MSDNEWLDAPTGDGWWWLLDGAGDIEPVQVIGKTAVDAFGLCSNERESLESGHFDLCKWQRIPEPAPPPKPLPCERQVTLTAQAFGNRDGYWNSFLIVNGVFQPWGPMKNTSKQEQIQWVRDTYGIEPEIVGEP